MTQGHYWGMRVRRGSRQAAKKGEVRMAFKDETQACLGGPGDRRLKAEGVRKDGLPGVAGKVSGKGLGLRPTQECLGALGRTACSRRWVSQHTQSCPGSAVQGAEGGKASGPICPPGFT